MLDVADGLLHIGLIGSLGAAFAAVALAFRYSGGSKSHNPIGFPDDSSASVPKYQSAFSQLVARATAPKLPKKPAKAADYSLKAFLEAKGIVGAAGPMNVQSALRPVKSPDQSNASQPPDRGA